MDGMKIRVTKDMLAFGVTSQVLIPWLGVSYYVVAWSVDTSLKGWRLM